MPGLGLFLSEDLEALVDRYVERQVPGDDPLARATVVVPNAAVGQWFEQAVARATGRPGHDDGVVANVDAIFPSGLLGRVLYGDHRALEAWGAAALALELRAQGGLELREALVRARVLETLILLRGDELDERLESPGLERERRLVAARAARGLSTPHLQLRRHGIDHAGLVGPRVAVVACAAAAWGDLLVEVCAALAEALPVDVYLPVASRGLLDAKDDGLAARWGAPSRARIERWTSRFAPEWVGDAPEGARVGGEGEVVVSASVEVHRCVGRARQVEVGRDLVLGDDVAAHRVRIASTDPVAVAPLLGLMFTPFDVGPTLQFEVAEPVVERPAPRLDALRALLGAGESDLTVGDVLDLLQWPALREGIGLDRAGTERVVRLATEGRVSLGIDAGDRSRRGVFDEGDDAGSWSRWVDRVALASVFESERPVEGDEVVTLGAPEDLVAAARVAELLSVVRDVASSASASLPVAEWTARLRRWATIVADDPRVREPSVERVLAALDSLDGEVELRFAEVRDLVEEVALTIGGGTLFGRGGAVMLPLVGAAALPFDVTCLIGLDDVGAPPRRDVDTMGSPRLTDPDPGADARDALLTMMATTRRRVIVLTDGRRVVDGAELEPTMLVAEVCDALAEAGVPVTVVDHPRHGFSVAGVVTPDLAERPDDALSADEAHEAAAGALAGPREDRPPLWSVEGEAPPEPAVDAARLVSFLRHPQRTFLRDVFSGARLLAEGARIPAAPLVDLGDSLTLWSLRDGILASALETGEIAPLPRGRDSAIGTVAAGMRSVAEASLDLDRIDRVARAVRDAVTSSGATFEPRFRVAGRAVGSRVEVTRGPLNVYRAPAGLLLVRAIVGRHFARHVLALAVDLAVATVESGEPVSGVLVRPRREKDKGKGDAPPSMELRWRDGVDGARRTLAVVLSLYRQRWGGLPRHVHETSLALGAQGHPAWRAAIDQHARDAWFRHDFVSGEDHGESLEPELRLTLPLAFDELVTIDDGVVERTSARLFEALAPLDVTVRFDGSWATRLGTP